MENIYFNSPIEFICKALTNKVRFDGEERILSNDSFSFRETSLREGLKKINWDDISELRISNPDIKIKLE